MRLTWLGHATVVLDIGTMRVLTDPLLRAHAGPLRRITPPPDPEAWAGAHGVLISHLHHDHAELGSLKLLPDLPYVLGAENAAWLRKRTGARVRTAELGEWISLGSLEVALVHADHHSRRMPHRPNQANGHLIRGEGQVIWFAGDTDLYDGMEEQITIAGPPDVALVPIGGWGPRLSPGHMGPTEAALACARTGAKAALPIHFGTFHARGMQYGGLHWMQRPKAEFARELAHHAPGCALLDVRLGGSIEV